MASEDRILEKYLVEKMKGREGKKPFSMCLPFMRTIDGKYYASFLIFP